MFQMNPPGWTTWYSNSGNHLRPQVTITTTSWPVFLGYESGSGLTRESAS